MINIIKTDTIPKHNELKHILSELNTYASPEEQENAILEITHQALEEEYQRRRNNIRILFHF